MLALLVLVLTIGLADSLNPSTVGPALYLAGGPDGRRSLARFIAGVFGVSTIGGLLLALGPGRVLMAQIHQPGRHTTSLIELALGAAAIALSVVLWIVRHRIARGLVAGTARTDRTSFALGAGIMAVELPTALPYFAVLAAVVASKQSVVEDTALIVLFNVAFVAPLLTILAIRCVAGGRVLLRLRTRFDRDAGALLAGLALVVGATLVVLGARGL